MAKEASWLEASLDMVYCDARPPALDQPCWMRLDGSGLELTFERKLPPAFLGRREGAGHYRIWSNLGGSGTLHRFARDSVFDGAWEMNGSRGFWRVSLKGEAPHLAEVIPMRGRRRRRSSVRAARSGD